MNETNQLKSFGIYQLFILVFILVIHAGEAQQRCGCNDCTDAILLADANGQTCAARIQTRIDSLGEDETTACTQVSSTYPTQCGPECHPAKCDGQAPALCYCDTCTEEVWTTTVGGFDCGTRILLSMSTRTEREACQTIAESYPAECGPCNPETCPSPAPTNDPTVAPTTTTAVPTNMTITSTQSPTAVPPEHCGCYECSDHWENNADGFTCAERIRYEQSAVGGGHSEEEACRRISERNPYTCGPGCHPDKCDGQQPDYCGCPDCTLALLQTQAGEFTCAQRIQSLRLPSGGNFSEVAACAKVAKDYEECSMAECNPTVCTGGIGFQGEKTEHEREGAPWAWAVLGANALFCIIIFVMYKKW